MADYIQRITIDPNICNGKPAIRGLRITVKTILEYLAAGETQENILNAYPVLSADDIKAALVFSAQLLDRSSYSNVEFV
ncbi:MAG: DUF433 domain-containing protein [Bacteroidales bacterium]|nr:DUF433 domain-containing protein [Bacteroidales bacterium]